MQPLTEDAAVAEIAATCFATGPVGKVGVELEWLVVDPRDSAVRPTFVVSDQHGYDGSITTEPGGQVELSSRVADSLDECVRRTTADLARLRAAADAAGVELVGLGLDPCRGPQRILDAPRYAAMEESFDRAGSAGRMMMCGTASVQVCLDAGPSEGLAARWRLVHQLGPVLVAAFANSPLWHGRPSGWRCTRQEVWRRIDRTRTAPPRVSDDPADDWVRYALDAQVLCIRGDGPWCAPDGLSFRDWLRGDGPRRPTLEDLRYHLTTLFPPVRPRGYLELRMIDAQAGDDWRVALAVATALLDDPAAADTARAAVASLGAGAWRRAARWSLADAALARAATLCFEAASEALSRLGVDPTIRAAVDAFTDRYVARGRCPADDVLDETAPCAA